jgi:transcriptional regulator with GAF, ATPase, and Fis domain
MERSVILSQGKDLRVPLSDLQVPLEAETDDAAATLEAMERREIQRALGACHGVIGGPDGAAARLGLKRTILDSRIKKLGIVRS